MKTLQQIHLDLMKAAIVGLSTPATTWYNRKLNLIPPGQAAKHAREIADAALAEYLNRWEK